MSNRSKPITDKKIPGTDVPDVSGLDASSNAQQRWLSRVGVTTAVLAACASVATMFSASYLNKAMLSQIEASDNWNFFQAKGIKLAVLEGRMETLEALGKAASGSIESDRDRAARYKTEQEGIRAEAASHQQLAKEHQKRHSRLSLASTAFQIAIAMSAVALLVRKNSFWVLSVVIGLVGVGILAAGLL